MTYATLQTLVDRFGQSLLVGLTDRAATATGLIDETVIARALADTDAVIDGYLGARYQVPLTEVPPLIADIAGSIAVWKLHTYKPDEKIDIDYREALRSLREIAAGTITLALPSQAVVPATGGTGARLTDRERPLTAENLTGFI